MRKLPLILLLLSPLAADICVAQTDLLNIVCEDCRDPHQYPDDFVNFAFNQLYGPDAWLSYEQADDFFITNLDNQTAYVDVDFVFLGIGLEGLRLPVWPTFLLQFTLALPDGTIVMAFRSKFQISLPVPSSDDSEPADAGNSSSSGGGGGGDEGEDYDDVEVDVDEWEEPEIDDHVGISWIEDPDEDGLFDDADWYEEEEE
jgi:hypothetical protein